MIEHKVTKAGESTERWAIRDPGFLGSIRQFVNCGRCGEPLPAKPHNEPRHFRDVMKPTAHGICDSCHDDLPE